MRRRDNQHPDLFDWADSRPATALPERPKVVGVVIDAEQKFLAREMAFYRLLMVGYKPPRSGGAPVFPRDEFARRRKARMAQKAALPREGRATG